METQIGSLIYARGPGFPMEGKLSEAVPRTRDRNALAVLGIKTVRQFLRFDLKEVLLLRGHGPATYRSLERARDVLQHEAGSEANGRPEPGPCWPGEPAETGQHTGGALRTSGLSLETPLADITLTPRDRKWLARLGIATVGDFLRLDLPRVPGVLRVRAAGLPLAPAGEEGPEKGPRLLRADCPSRP